jgi:signal transduction histidine kinase
MTAGRRTLRAWLFPRAEAEDEKFRVDVHSASLLGLRLLSAHAIAIPPLLGLARFRLIPTPLTHFAAMAPPVIIVGLGLAALFAMEVRVLRPHARAIAALLAFLIAAVLIGFVLFGSAHIATHDHMLPGYLCLLMLVTVVAVPFRPMQALALGLSIDACYVILAAIAGDRDIAEHAFLTLLAFLACALAAAAYERRIANYHTREQALRANEYLCLAQSRVLLSENAASLGRLAATLVHELNTPLGALASSVDTMMVLSSKQATAQPEEQQRLLTLQGDLRNSILASLERLQQTTSRIERLTALDESEFQSVDVNELLRDAAALVETRSKNPVNIEFDLLPLPALICQSQQLSAVFSNVISNAMDAMDGSDPVTRCGAIRVSTARKDSQIEIRVQDCGRGIAPDDLAQIFEPGFKTAAGRISTGNWSLFSSRQIIHGHGGEMYITSAEGKGSTVVITLPF